MPDSPDHLPYYQPWFPSTERSCGTCMHGARRAAFLGLSSKNSGLCPYNGEDLPLCAAAKIKFSGVTKAR